MKITKCMALVLCLVMLLSLIACGAGDEAVQTTTGGNSPVVTDATTTTEKAHLDDLPDDLNLNGRTFSIISRDIEGCKDEVSVDTLNGELINDAIYNRNLAVCDRLNCKIENFPQVFDSNKEVMTAVEKQVMSGSDEFDMYVSASFRTSEALPKNLSVNLSGLEYVDLSKPYWSQGYLDAASLCGNVYFANGAICLTFYRFVFATFFNKNTFDNYQIPYLYEAVKDGTWTLDYQFEIADSMYEDLNGNSKSDTGDHFGFAANHDCISVDPYWSSCQLTIMTKTDDDHLVFNLNTEKMADAIVKINHLFWDTDATFRIATDADREQEVLYKMFGESSSATTTLRLVGVESESLRNMSDLYGIVPMPKLNEEQDGYYSLLHDNTSCVGIPNSIQGDKLEMTGAFMEALAAESYKTLVPAYYEQALKTKYVSDEESVQMLDMVINNVYIDPGILYVQNTSGFHQKLRSWVSTGNSNISAGLKASAKVLDKVVATLNDVGDDLKDKNS